MAAFQRLLPLVALASFSAADTNSTSQPEDAAQKSPEERIREIENDYGPKPDCENGGVSTFDMVRCGDIELIKAEVEQQRYFKIARARFVENVNDASNEDTDVDKRKAIDTFDSSQRNWERYSDEHCSSYRYNWKGGTIAGPYNVWCRLELTRERTWEIWKYWLHYADSTPPILPEPKTTRRREK
jgi:uncharacterized protein YecT (DUF1311 family)